MRQSTAFDILKTGMNVFLTGQAGSGKTYLLNQYIQYCYQHDIKIGVTASTGIAATHIGGKTIHSWAGIGIRDYIDDESIRAMLKKPYLRKALGDTKVLVIDEISMLSPNVLIMVDQVLKEFNRSPLPFGGVQLVLCGDFFQLPPVNKSGEEREYCWQSEIWEQIDPSICYLTDQYRHDDERLAAILNEIRSGEVSLNTFSRLDNDFKNDPVDFSQPIKLYTHNVDTDRINARQLAELNADDVDYTMNDKGNKNLVAALKRSTLAPETLTLKKGARVVFVKNNYDKGYQNGTLGEIVGFSHPDEYPIVKTVSGDKITAEPDTWSLDEEGKTVAQVTQVPLRLAWAITIHKSQGMSLDCAEIDLSKAFEPGQGYVALSRLKTLAGLKLMGINRQALQVDPDVLIVDSSFKRFSNQIEGTFEHLDEGSKRTRWESFIRQSGGSLKPVIKQHSGNGRVKKPAKPSTVEQTLKLVEQGQSIKDMAAERELTISTIATHLKKIRVQYPDADLSPYRPEQSIIDRVRESFEAVASAADEPQSELDEKLPLQPIHQHLGKKVSYLNIKLSLLFLN